MTNNYGTGRRFEYEVIRHLRSVGWKTRRAYASKGIFDVLAYKDGHRCKSLQSNKNRGYLTPDELKSLIDYYNKPIIPYIFVTWHKEYNFPVLEKLDQTFRVVHAYNTFPDIVYKEYTGEWKRLYP